MPILCIQQAYSGEFDSTKYRLFTKDCYSCICDEYNYDSVKHLARLCGICFRYYSALHANLYSEYITSNKAFDYILLLMRSKEIIYSDTIMHKHTKNKIVIFTHLFSSNTNYGHMNACNALCSKCYNKSS